MVDYACAFKIAFGNVVVPALREHPINSGMLAYVGGCFVYSFSPVECKWPFCGRVKPSFPAAIGVQI